MTEHNNVALAKEGYAAFSAGDMDKVRELFAPDIVWHVPGNNIISGDYKGQDEVFGFFAKLMQETGGNFRNEVHDVLANDDHTVVLVNVHAERNGKSLDQPAVHIWHTDGEGHMTEFWGMTQDSAEVDEFWS